MDVSAGRYFRAFRRPGSVIPSLTDSNVIPLDKKARSVPGGTGAGRPPVYACLSSRQPCSSLLA
uniref:Uncharacterized protein n=1 Tax=Anopheles dirus TaxID=7168 RepID=A0A182NXU1_9DIPT